MARIPDDEIERLKKEIPIERLVKGFGVEFKPTGANLVARCPFHDDRTPSLIVTPPPISGAAWASATSAGPPSIGS
jgi:DNA primase